MILNIFAEYFVFHRLEKRQPMTFSFKSIDRNTSNYIDALLDKVSIKLL